MSCRRIQFLSLDSVSRVWSVPLDCHAFLLRATPGGFTSTINGVQLFELGATVVFGAVELDTFPVFDDTGAPVPFNDQFQFTTGPEGMVGCLVRVYLDPERPSTNP